MPDARRTVPIPLKYYRVYDTAARILRRKLGMHGPDVVTLICFELSYRQAQMIADDYLETQIPGSVLDLAPGRSRSGGRPGRRQLRPPSSDPSLN